MGNPASASQGDLDPAPGLQPVVTAGDTPGVHHPHMRRTERKGSGADKASTAESLPELRPWREVGWIFRDGDCIAIERQGDETRARVLD